MNGRSLTAAETVLARSVFGDAIDYSRVKVFARKWWPFQPRQVAMAPDGNLWLSPKGSLYCDDFCRGQTLRFNFDIAARIPVVAQVKLGIKAIIVFGTCAAKGSDCP